MVMQHKKESWGAGGGGESKSSPTGYIKSWSGIPSKLESDIRTNIPLTAHLTHTYCFT